MDKFMGTPGPFKACTDVANWYGFENRFFEVVDQDNMIVAFVKDWTGAGETPKLDAKLLAAAPELLEALQLSVSVIKNMADPSQSKTFSLELATAAINKALGK